MLLNKILELSKLSILFRIYSISNLKLNLFIISFISIILSMFAILLLLAAVLDIILLSALLSISIILDSQLFRKPILFVEFIISNITIFSSVFLLELEINC